MSEFKYEIGDEFKTVYGRLRTIIARHESESGLVLYWCVDADGGEACTWDEHDLEAWTKIEPFFKVGDSYTNPYGDGATCVVTHVSEDPKSAWVTVSTGSHRFKESVGQITWNLVKEEILRNRKG